MAAMNKLFRKSDAIAADPDELEIDRKIRSLGALRVATTLEILALEKAGRSVAKPSALLEAIGARAAEFLGEKPPKQDSKSLDALYLDRDAIDAALVIANRRSMFEHGELQRQRIADAAPAWAALVKRRALAVATLIRLNLEAEEFATDLMTIHGQVPGLAGVFPSHRLLGNGRTVGTPAYVFLQAAVAGGFVTPKEINNA